VPFAVAARAAGHDAAFFGRRSAARLLDGFGFPSFVDPVESATATATAIGRLVPVDMEREYRVLRDGFADRIARAHATVDDVIAAYRPDLIVSDEVDFGSMLAAERLGLPHATVLTNASGSFVRPERVTPALDALRRELGLPPDPHLAMPARHLVLSPFPPSFRDPSCPLPPTAASFDTSRGPRPTLDPALGAWLDERAAPVVYVTLGTVFNVESGDLFERVLAGVGSLPVRAVITVGEQLDPDTFGPRSDDIRIERYVPQSALLQHCDVVVNHGGSGSVAGALAHGAPLVVIPMGADQPLNAARCVDLEVGLSLDAIHATPDDIAHAVSAVLSDDHYRVAAGYVRDEMSALPGPEGAVPLIEGLL
jgi:UDP:flavonoid glycosyltransferase YjiC (YdhE family)